MRHIRDEGIISASTCLRRAAGWLAGPLLGLLASQNSAAQTTVTYDYDSLGRLVQAQMPALGSVQSYTYDAAGNILSSNLTALTTLSIGGVSVSQGPSGTQVTIYGSGFSTTPAQNSVNFNGTAATVISATGTQLVVLIPSGASTGNLTVTTGGTTVTSSTPFTVTPAIAAPTITSFTPVLGAPASTLTITGSNFDSVAVNNKIQFGSSAWTSGTARTATTLSTVIPPKGAWGKIRVLTPKGQAVSTADFFSPPTGFTVSTIGFTGRLAAGTPSTITLSTSGQSSLQVFDGAAGDLLALGLTNDMMSTLGLQVFSPDGSLLGSATMSASGQGMQLPPLPRSGTYEVVATQSGPLTGAATLTLAAPVQGTLTSGSPQTVNLTIPGQRALLALAGTQGSYLSLALSSVSLSAGTVSILAPDGSVLISNTFSTSGIILRPQLPATGTYQVLIAPTGSIAGNATVTASNLSIDAPPDQAAFNVNVSGLTPVTVATSGTAGQFLAIAVGQTQCGVTGASAIAGTFAVITPDGTQLATANYSSLRCGNGGWAGSSLLNIGPLPQSGSYAIVFTPTSSVASGILSFNVTSPQMVGPLVPNSPATSVSFAPAASGRPMLVSFSGTEGQIVAFNMSQDQCGNAAATSVIGSLALLSPDGVQLATDSFSSAQSCGYNPVGGGGQVGAAGTRTLNFGPLPKSGTYQVLMQQTAPVLNINAVLKFVVSTPISAGPLTVNGAPTPVNLTSPPRGQGILVSLPGVAGQYLALNVAQDQCGVSGATWLFGSLTVINPDGTPLSTGSFSSAQSCGWSPTGGTTYQGGAQGATVINLGPLPATGTYKVLLQQPAASADVSGILKFSVSSPITTGPMAVNGAPTSITLTPQPPVQGALVSFAGVSGQILAVNLWQSQCGTVDATGISGPIAVLKPDGTQLTTANFSSTQHACGGIAGAQGGLTLNIGPLPATGTYRVLLQQPVNVISLNATLNFSVTSPITAGSMTLNGAAVAATIVTPPYGQGALASFSGTTGQNVSVTIAESQCGNTNGITGVSGPLTVFRPDGTVLVTGSFAGTTRGCGGIAGAAGSITLNLGNLPATGVYQVLLQQGVYSSSVNATVNFSTVTH